ncbi:uncharacterized protein MELLADRAFT_87725 [Melampsora larici-populina 98AG31]|uniref:Uncharacterized protein n=1 Tax=Melampsora larici-populina (strain 98AG31 / pathotype 3-4-7) TaxID=747676 RepID=F4RNV1_MELLP|nr:uncharacterized protein MELLADRAFT_87725 [Melampsora larici-populina 98AG31]EGG05809.1 hypothetical protein MELLADRAFT_87725 [Melampsora larici-populina 98AG31]
MIMTSKHLTLDIPLTHDLAGPLRSPYPLNKPSFNPTNATDDDDLSRLEGKQLRPRREFPQNHQQPSEPMPRLTEAQKIMALSYRDSQDKRSAVTFLYFALGCVGKVTFGFGAAMAVKGKIGETQDDGTFNTGVILASVGAIAVITAALGFGAAITRVHLKIGWTIKSLAILAGTLIAIGDGLAQYYYSSTDNTESIRLCIFPLVIGTSILAITLPNMVAYTELYRGRSIGIPSEKRSIFALACIGCANGSFFGGWVTGEHAQWPSSFNMAVVTVALASSYLGAAIFWSDHIRELASSYHELDSVIKGCKAYKLFDILLQVILSYLVQMISSSKGTWKDTGSAYDLHPTKLNKSDPEHKYDSKPTHHKTWGPATMHF